MLLKLKRFFKQETVLCVAVLLACASSFVQRPRLEYIDFAVLSILLSLMLVVAGLKSVSFLDWVALKLLQRCASWRSVALALVGVTYVSSMFVTNDVALITFVPLALIIGKRLQRDVARVIILQTLAANLGSMVTPPGNPQNLFLYAHYHYTASSFFAVMALPVPLHPPAGAAIHHLFGRANLAWAQRCLEAGAAGAKQAGYAANGFTATAFGLEYWCRAALAG